MTVRTALGPDIPRLVGLAKAEHARSPWQYMAFDEVYVGGMFRLFIESFGRVVFTTPGGYLAGLLQPAGFSRATIAMEYAFYAEDGEGMSMLDAFESWAQSMGAHAVVVNDFMGDDRLAGVLRRRRFYTHIGTTLVRPTEGRMVVPHRSHPTERMVEGVA